MSLHNEQPPTDFALEHLGLDTLAQFVGAALDGIVVIDSGGHFIYANPAACDVMGYTLEELVGQDFRKYVPQRLHQSMGEAFAASIQGVTGRYSSALLRPDGSEREIEYSNMRFEIDGEAILAAIFEDVTTLHRQAREAATLSGISSAMTVNLSMEETADTLAAGVVETTSAIAAAVIIVNMEQGRMEFAGLYNLPDTFSEVIAATWPPPPTSPTFTAFETLNSQLRHNVRERLLGSDVYGGMHDYIRNDAEWDTLLATPMSYRGAPIGALMTFYPEEQAISNEEMAFLNVIADQAAVAIANTQLYQEAQRMAALRERQRLSRDLHDSVSQVLYSIVLGATTSRRLLEQNPTAAAEPLDYVLSLADAGLAEMRALIFDLRPESLETEGLIAALDKQAAYLRARHNISVTIDVCSEPDLPLQTKETIYHIAQEALHNTVKHAHATEVMLCLERNETGDLTLRLHDNGVGFDPDRPSSDRRGLKTMSEDARRLGGTFTIESAPGGGTRTSVAIPVAGHGA